MSNIKAEVKNISTSSAIISIGKGDSGIIVSTAQPTVKNVIWITPEELNATDISTLTEKMAKLESILSKSLSRALTINYNFNNQLVGTAQGILTLASTDPNFDGTYDIYWANESGKLNGYDKLTSITIDALVNSYSHNFVKANTIPIGTTKIIAVRNNIIEKEYIIPTNKLLASTAPLYKFGLLSDVHIDGDGTDTSSSIADFTKALQFFDAQKVAMICISGDVTADGRAVDAVRYKELIEARTNVYVARGNHDCFNDCANIDYYKSKIDSHGLYFEVLQGNDIFLFVGMNSALSTYANCFTEEEITWLSGRLEAYKTKRVFVIEHVFINPVGNVANLYPWINLEGNTNTDTSTKFINLMKQYKNVILCTGHSHLEFSLQRLSEDANIMDATSELCKRVHTPSCAKPRANDISTPDTSANTYDRHQGSQGYLVEVYSEYVLFKGYDFETNKFIPFAQYILNTPVTTEWQPPLGSTIVYRGSTDNGFLNWSIVSGKEPPTISSSTSLTFTANGQRLAKNLNLVTYKTAGKKLYCYTPNFTYSNATTDNDKLAIYMDDLDNGATQTTYRIYGIEKEVLALDGTNLLTASTSGNIGVRIQASSTSTAILPCTISVNDFILYVI